MLPNASYLQALLVLLDFVIDFDFGQGPSPCGWVGKGLSNKFVVVDLLFGVLLGLGDVVVGTRIFS